MARTLASLVRRIKRTNARFARATPARKRMMIAQDVLDGLRNRELSRTGNRRHMGGYVTSAHERAALRADPSADFRDMMPKLPVCGVCAKGSLFLCTIARRDKVTAGQFAAMGYGGWQLSEAMGGIFSPEQLTTIERAYEGNDDWSYQVDWRESGEPSTDARMTWVMQNIIHNGGEFKWPRAPRPPLCLTD